MNEDPNPPSYFLDLKPHTLPRPYHLTNDMGQYKVPTNNEGTQLSHGDIAVEIHRTSTWYPGP